MRSRSHFERTIYFFSVFETTKLTKFDFQLRSPHAIASTIQSGNRTLSSLEGRQQAQTATATGWRSQIRPGKAIAAFKIGGRIQQWVGKKVKRPTCYQQVGLFKAFFKLYTNQIFQSESGFGFRRLCCGRKNLPRIPVENYMVYIAPGASAQQNSSVKFFQKYLQDEKQNQKKECIDCAEAKRNLEFPGNEPSEKVCLQFLGENGGARKIKVSRDRPSNFEIAKFTIPTPFSSQFKRIASRAPPSTTSPLLEDRKFYQV